MIELASLAGYLVGVVVGLYLMYRYVGKPVVGKLRALAGGIRD